MGPTATESLSRPQSKKRPPRQNLCPDDTCPRKRKKHREARGPRALNANVRGTSPSNRHLHWDATGSAAAAHLSPAYWAHREDVAVRRGRDPAGH
ncbi:hypothetical protein AAC387_Pa04g1975 [Persea americana]